MYVSGLLKRADAWTTSTLPMIAARRPKMARRMTTQRMLEALQIKAHVSRLFFLQNAPKSPRVKLARGKRSMKAVAKGKASVRVV